MTNDELAGLALGQTVFLNSGSPGLTVTGWEDDSLSIAAINEAPRNDPKVLREVEVSQVAVSVCWIGDNAVLHTASIPAACLKTSRAVPQRDTRPIMHHPV